MTNRINLSELMYLYSIPKRKLYRLINKFSYQDIEDFLVHKHNFSTVTLGSKHIKWYLEYYEELRDKGISHYKCKIII